MEMPYHLRTLPPEALDIMRFYGSSSAIAAYADDIVEGSGLSNRGFGKAIRRLVTIGYLTMDGNQVYRLTDQGRRLVEEISLYDNEQPDVPAAPRTPTPQARRAYRRLVVALPRVLLAGQATHIYVGFDEATEDQRLSDSLNVVLKAALMNGQTEPGQSTFLLANRAARQVFTVTAEQVKQARLRVEVFQLLDDTGEYERCGGLYVDVIVVSNVNNLDSTLVAYSADVLVQGVNG